MIRNSHLVYAPTWDQTKYISVGGRHPELLFLYKKNLSSIFNPRFDMLLPFLKMIDQESNEFQLFFFILFPKQYDNNNIVNSTYAYRVPKINGMEWNFCDTKKHSTQIPLFSNSSSSGDNRCGTHETHNKNGNRLMQKWLWSIEVRGIIYAVRRQCS